jgi:hypothetical protein
MTIRVGFDMDGVVADFATAYREVERRLFGEKTIGRTDEPEREERAREKRESRAARERGETPAELHPPHELRRRRDLIWKEIQATPDFWVSLRPIEETGVRRIYDLMLAHRWEVFFITQRPNTAGETVQRQSQRWLVEQGFDLPSVLVIGGSRGAAAAALRLSYHVDDNPQNCSDVKSESTARPLLIAPDSDPLMVDGARKLGIGMVPSLAACLDILEQASAAESQPGLLERLAALVGWGEERKK